MKTSVFRKLAGIGMAFVAASALSSTMMPSASANGVFAAAGTASFPVFPCPAGCAGSMSLSGAALSTTNGHGAGTISASLSYLEPNGVTCPLVGTASGSLNGAGLAANFGWSRVGLVALVVLRNVTFNGGFEPDGMGVALLAPVPVPPLGQPGGCANTATASGLLLGIAMGGTL